VAWTKLGRIFVPPGRPDWIVSHAATPFARHRAGDEFRVYISGRDGRGRSQIGYFDLDLDHLDRPARVANRPVVGLGDLGMFDDSGIVGPWITDHAGRLYLYYGGWHLGATVPFYTFVGLAIGEDDGESFARHSPAPILDRSPHDPCMTGPPCVLVEDGRWRMWYLSGIRWEIADGSPRHYYHIKYAESDDGIHWRRDGLVCIDFGPGEYAIARPSVLRDGSTYRMWYSYRGAHYRIGYAESDDGLTWRRLDHLAGIEPGPEPWDAEMIEYGHVFRHREQLYMLYNGNGYGRTGVGLAVWHGAHS